ncbi:MAG TPA: YceI family protein [Deltaproteobacteria bacterium]|nr:YceI family protein [Deltaproteobacteria bacterium]
MHDFTASDSHCYVFTFKRGALAALGHDLKLEVGRFTLTLDGPDSHATFDPASLRVICAMHEGEERRGTLSDSDRATIDGHVSDDILHPRRYPEIRWRCTAITHDGPNAWRLEGQLTLHGETRPLVARVEQRDGRLRTRVRLQQSAFGIRPFRALLGALKIADEIEVELVVPDRAREHLEP